MTIEMTARPPCSATAAGGIWGVARPCRCPAVVIDQRDNQGYCHAHRPSHHEWIGDRYVHVVEHEHLAHIVVADRCAAEVEIANMLGVESDR